MQEEPVKRMNTRSGFLMATCGSSEQAKPARRILTSATEMVSKLPSGATSPRRSDSINVSPCWYQNKTPSISVTCILLPLLFVVLLPTIKIEQNPANRDTYHDRQLVDRVSLPWRLTNEILLPILRFPMDRLRLVSGFSVAFAKEINNRRDLQEEETQMMLLAPAEHRAAYLAPTGYQQQVSRSQPGSYGVQTGEAAAASETGHPSGEYGAGGDIVEAPAGTVEGTVEPTSSGVGSTSGATLPTRNDLPAVRALNVKCEKNHMTVNIVFDRPFYGMVFSKGHYNDQKCVHLPANSGQTSVNFDIHLGKCGMSSSDSSGAGYGTSGLQQQSASQQPQPNGLYIENTIIIQYDPQVQEIYDQARKLRCTWYDYYEKSVTFRPYNVDMLDAVTANFLGDNIQCWMQIQVGKGPWSSEVAGIVKIGQTMTMVLAIKDDENRFDMLVRNCVAHDGKHQPIQLVDEYGCVARPKIMGRFQKVRNFGPAATVVSYAHFQAFKFPDSMSVHFQCVIQVCRYESPEPDCEQSGATNEIAGSPAASGSQVGDYAASGTELISRKEPLPGTSYLLANHSSLRPSSILSSSGGSHAQSALKLDESQGRVQVKLDTSMMAALGRAQAPQTSATHNGPLPPHLLHTASDSDQPTHVGPSSAPPRAFISSSAPFYSKANEINMRPTSNSGSNVRLQAATPSSMQQQLHLSPGVHYSSPYPTSSHQIHHRSMNQPYATNRLGELALSGKHQEDQEEGVNPLSLIAMPRALRMAAPTNSTSLPMVITNHRDRRSVSNLSADELKHLRNGRSSDQSTAIKTQKTIQVVSSDDVAFSLLASEDLQPVTVNGINPQMRYQTSKQTQTNEDLSTVCFSAARFISVVLITLALVATSIVIVAFVILRQRSQLGRKLSSVFEDPSAQARIAHCQAGHVGLGGRRFREDEEEDEDVISRRQREEIQQRNRCLTRLYSQFMPATYWQR